MNIKVGDRTIEISPTDAPDSIPWDAAVEWCTALGDGWRLPTKDELSVLYEQREVIGGFTPYRYWSSSKRGHNGAWTQYFGSGKQYGDYKSYRRRVRAVRDAATKTTKADDIEDQTMFDAMEDEGNA